MLLKTGFFFYSNNGKVIKTLTDSVISECISLFYRNGVGKASQYCRETELHWNREVSLKELFLRYICICLWPELETGGTPTAPGAEEIGRRSEQQSASQRERRPEETALTCVSDFADVCWGQSRATFIVITEAALCWSHLSCIFCSFFSPRISRFWLRVHTKCLSPHKPTCQYANISLSGVQKCAFHIHRLTQTNNN